MGLYIKKTQEKTQKLKLVDRIVMHPLKYSIKTAIPFF